jgi:hypothetical protein
MSDSAQQSQATGGIIQTTGDLAKSVGRFSLAMSLLATRQMASMVVPSKEASPSSMDEVTKAAGNQLSGTMRTAYAIGTNVQSGLVDAAFGLVGQTGPAGQAPKGDTTGLSVPLMARATRRVSGVKTVASGALSRPIPQDEVVERLTLFHKEATTGTADRAKSVAGLWKSEGLATSIGKHLLPENTLADARLSPAVLPIAHVGFGSGSTEALLFDPAKLKALFEARCEPNHLGFAYEGIGAILRIYERGFFKVMSGSLGLIPLDAPDGPDGDGFFAAYLAQYPPDIQRLIAHGYGRLVAFSNIDIYTAIQHATSFPAERIEPAVHGAGFAFVMMNSEDLPKILEASAVPFDAPVRAAFQNGLMYALVFFDWYVPGLLAGWQAQGPLETELIAHARREADLSRSRGYLLPFRLENPRT